MAKRKKIRVKRVPEKTALYVSLFLLILVLTLLLLYFFDKPLEVRVLDANFIVGESVGFDVNSTALVFGRLPPKGVGVKKISLQNQYDFPIEVEVFASKNIAGYLEVEPSFDILPSEIKEVSFRLIIPHNATFGNYSGKVLIEVRKK